MTESAKGEFPPFFIWVMKSKTIIGIFSGLAVAGLAVLAYVQNFKSWQIDFTDFIIDSVGLKESKTSIELSVLNPSSAGQIDAVALNVYYDGYLLGTVQGVPPVGIAAKSQTKVRLPLPVNTGVAGRLVIDRSAGNPVSIEIRGVIDINGQTLPINLSREI